MFSDTNRQLRKLSIYKPMQFLITHIDFEIDDSIYDPSVDVITSEELALNYVGEIWEADDEDDLVEDLTNDSAHCILSIDYRIVQK